VFLGEDWDVHECCVAVDFDPCTAEVSIFSFTYDSYGKESYLLSRIRLIARRALPTAASSASTIKLDGLVSAYKSASLQRASNRASSSDCRRYMFFSDRSMFSSRQAFKSLVYWFATMMAC
jgi:hypothetical protein